jgi:hypothetical protein
VVLVPLVLVWVHLLPAASRRPLTLSMGQPTMLAAYTTHFVHLSWHHLLGNMGAYAVAARTGRLGLFRGGVVVALGATPLVLSGPALMVASRGSGAGSSGLNMALFGLFVVPFGHLRSRALWPALDRWGAELYLLSLAAFASLVVPDPRRAAGLFIATLLTVILVAGSVGERTRRRHPQPWSGREVLAATAGGLVLILVVLGVIFPLLEATTPGMATYIHLLGYEVGFLAPHAASRATGGTALDATGSGPLTR